MRITVLWDLKSNEVERFAIASFVIGVVMFLAGLCWDWIAGVNVQHAKGLGTMQILWLAFWGLYTFWAWYVCSRWGER